MKKYLLLQISALLIFSCGTKNLPAPYGAVPHARQLKWHKIKYYAFIHFGPNTFTDMEWGYGDEPESLFNPAELDCRQWARTVSKAGMKGIIITAKHHDGFCLWPSAYTEHSVKKSPWKNGKGDIIKELQKACHEYGLELGIYLSPWDRNHAAYGSPEYLVYYRNQLRELLTNYGQIFEVWFDGAMGGDGWYGGAKELRRINNKIYYDWPNTFSIVRELQPEAVMFSDGGPDVRWVGNERGYAAVTNWCTMKKDTLYPGIGGVNRLLQEGREGGDSWLPAEVNTSIRPGWFYHKSQDDKVKSLKQLIDNWFSSVGMNGNFLLNLPPDQRGLIHENDAARLREFKSWREAAFADNLTRYAKISASEVRRGSPRYKPASAIDDNPETYWAVNDNCTLASIKLTFTEPVKINTLLLQEYIPLGQRVTTFMVEYIADGKLVEIYTGTTIGNLRLARFDEITTKQLKITIKGKACPLISNLEAYYIQADY